MIYLQYEIQKIHHLPKADKHAICLLVLLRQVFSL